MNAIVHPDWPEARFNISGMFSHEPLIARFLDVTKQNFGCDLPIEAIHGAPKVPWNAGRPTTAVQDRREFEVGLEWLYARGIGYFPTFTNHHITAGELDNADCNFILDTLHHRLDLNGVIVTSDLLAGHITRRCPGLRQIASVTKVSLDGGKGRVEYYQQLEKRFVRYVVDPDDGRNLKLLDSLDRDKAEIIVNENCVVHCPHRARHYDISARLQLGMGTANEPALRQELAQIGTGCRSPISLRSMGPPQRSCNLTRQEMKAVYDMGFRHFKLQGRGDDRNLYLYDLTRYLLEPEFAAPLVFKILCTWLSQVPGRKP
ncbi:MAG: hypothetical protein WCO57_01595 [Verrucomicrobiota bacterium]